MRDETLEKIAKKAPWVVLAFSSMALPYFGPQLILTARNVYQSSNAQPHKTVEETLASIEAEKKKLGLGHLDINVRFDGKADYILGVPNSSGTYVRKVRGNGYGLVFGPFKRSDVIVRHELFHIHEIENEIIPPIQNVMGSYFSEWRAQNYAVGD